MLYQALFSFQDIRQRVVRWGDLDHSRIEVFQPGATEDLGLWFVEDGGGMAGGLIYNSDILLEQSILQLRERYMALLRAIRSEEHTSELQSLMRISYAVFCLKKKKNTNNTSNSTIN